MTSDANVHPTRISRRKFIQLGALTSTAMAVSGCTINLQRSETIEPYVIPPEESLPGENVWYATTCRMCSAGCGIIVRVSNGRARKIEGNPLHPLNAGKTCARGQAGLQYLYNPDRLRNAVRNEARGSGSGSTARLRSTAARSTTGWPRWWRHSSRPWVRPRRCSTTTRAPMRAAARSPG